MDTKDLDPRSNSPVRKVRYVGGFGQPDGFSSVLEMTMSTDGEVQLTLHYRTNPGFSVKPEDEHLWSIRLTNEQRKQLAEDLTTYHPRLWCHDDIKTDF